MTMRDSTSRPDASPAADAAAPQPFPWLLLGWALPLLAATLGGFCGDWHWGLDLMSHFRWYYLLAAAGGLGIAVMRRVGIATRTTLAPALALNAWTMLPYWLPATQPAAPAAGQNQRGKGARCEGIGSLCATGRAGTAWRSARQVFAKTGSPGRTGAAASGVCRSSSASCNSPTLA